MLEPQVVNLLGEGPQTMSGGRHLGVPGMESGTWGTPSFAITAEGPWTDSIPLRNVHFFINKNRNNSYLHQVGVRVKQDEENKMPSTAEHKPAVFFVPIMYKRGPVEER